MYRCNVLFRSRRVLHDGREKKRKSPQQHHTNKKKTSPPPQNQKMTYKRKEIIPDTKNDIPINECSAPPCSIRFSFPHPQYAVSWWDQEVGEDVNKGPEAPARRDHPRVPLIEGFFCLLKSVSSQQTHLRMPPGGEHQEAETKRKKHSNSSMQGHQESNRCFRCRHTWRMPRRNAKTNKTKKSKQMRYNVYDTFADCHD